MPEWQNGKTCQPCARRRQSVCQRAHTHFCEGRTRMVERRNLLEPSSPPEINFLGSEGSHMLRPPHALSPRTVPFSCPSNGGMGAWRPMFTIALCLSPPSNFRPPRMLSFRTIPAPVKGVWGLSPHVYHSPCPSTPMLTDCPHGCQSGSFPPACPFLPELTEISYLGLVKKMPTD